MVWAALLVVLAADTGKESRAGEPVSPIEMTVVPKTDPRSRWCARPTFKAIITNTSVKPVWLDLGERDRELVVTSHFEFYEWDDGGAGGGMAIATSDDWIGIEELRSAHATVLRPGAHAIRRIRLENVRLRSARATMDVTVRIFGTQGLDAPDVRTYQPAATLTLALRRIGRCFEVRERRDSEDLPSP